MTPESQFDFWLGSWRATFEGGSATNTVTKEYGGKVVVERFSQPKPEPFTGLSVSVYDPREGCWKQTWVDDAGAYLDFRGGFADGAMALTRRFVDDGVTITQRMIWHEIENDRFSWLWQRARGAGEWETLWAIAYERAG
jgi:hypothetical protein